MRERGSLLNVAAALTALWFAPTGLAQCPGPLLGDLDNDCDVDLADLAELLSHYGATSGATCADGDFDRDGDVDLADLAELLGAYGSSCW